MQRIKVSDLRPGARFSAPLFGLDGEVILLAYQEIDPVTLRALRGAGVDVLCLCEAPEDAMKLRTGVQHDAVSVADLEPGKRLDCNLYSDNGRILLAAGQRVQQGHLDLFERRNIRYIFRYHSEDSVTARRFRELLRQYTVEQLLEDPGESVLGINRYGSPSIAANWGTLRPNEREPAQIIEAHKVHVERLKTVAGALQVLRQEGRLDIPVFHDLARDIVEDTAVDRLLLLALAGNALHEEYLADHCLGVAIFSVVIAAMAGYAPENLLDIGLGALLHDIGMTALPEEILRQPGPLNPMQREHVQRHPEEGFRILNDLTGLDRHVHAMVFQSHERYEGQGYPRGRRQKLIHEYARILAIADTYQALITPRPYRGGALPLKAMETLLDLTKQRYFDPILMKVFFTAMGLFPVGSWVRLNTGFVARVVQPGGGDYTRPLVSIVFDREGKHLERPILLDLSSCRKTRIKEPVDDEEVGLDIAAGFHSNGPILPGLRPEKQEETERWLVPDELMDWSASFQGSLADIRLIDVIQLLDLAQKNGILIVNGPGKEGRIYFDGGAMVRAEIGDVKDEDAVFSMLGFDNGNFSFVQKSVAVPRTVKMTNTSLLLEALRRHDESARSGG
ncbi:MAG: DUF4388 domain-containing protein [Planctomycetes bacterium]|nr:DUF4388 domain-containing protein [Planctomycetota bacterium]